MAYRNIGLSIRGYTTTQLNDLVTRYGTSGTTEANALRNGTLVRDMTTGALKVYQLSTNTFVGGVDVS